jgi:2',3'-cyclic-nucleotide 2'-phosphodiesterase (5'-nucleotidase family)
VSSRRQRIVRDLSCRPFNDCYTRGVAGPGRLGKGRSVNPFPALRSALLLSLTLGLAHGAEKKAAEESDLVELTQGMQGVHKLTGPIKATSEQLIASEVLAGHKTGTLVVLHTNDIHDILKAPAKGLGGLPYVAGYANGLRAKRPDVLFVDAGDISEKGDAMGPASKGEASYLALASIGLDATVPGNHDFIYGLDRLLANARTSRIPILCAGLEYDDTKEPVLPEATIKQIGSLKVGLIGATLPRSAHSADRKVNQFAGEVLGKRIDELARKMESQVDLTVLVIHNGTFAAKAMAKAAPTLDVVVCGHTNEITEVPMKAETGCLVVTVGRAGQWVGNLDLVVDRDQKKIAKYTFELIPMDHEKIKPDNKVAATIDALDKKWTTAVK